MTEFYLTKCVKHHHKSHKNILTLNGLFLNGPGVKIYDLEVNFLKV